MMLFSRERNETLPLQRVYINSHVKEPAHFVQVHQVYYNPHYALLEATFRFPLPSSAAINEFQATYGGHTIRARLEESQEA